MNAHTRNTNIAIFTRACWLAAVARSCRRCGATEAEIADAVSLYIADDLAMALSVFDERGAHLDRRAS